MASRSRSTVVRVLGAAILLGAVVAAVALLAVPQGAGADTTPTPQATAATGGSGKLVLDTGWLEDPDNLNPFIGYTLTA